MLFYLTLIFCCQLLGELFVGLTGLPVPGPVVGMALLFAGLMLRGALPADLATAADALIGHLSLLFVPAGVGVMLHAGLIGREALPISVALVASTLLTVAVTAGVMVMLTRRPAAPDADTGAGGENA